VNPVAHLSEIERIGKPLFGTPRRLRFGIWIATLPGTRERTFCVTEYWEWLQDRGVEPFRPAVGVDAKNFLELDMLRLWKPDDPRVVPRAKFYTRTTSPLWDVFLMAAVVLKEEYAAHEGRARRAMADLMALREELASAVEAEREAGLSEGCARCVGEQGQSASRDGGAVQAGL
jgi:hypothetical protein